MVSHIAIGLFIILIITIFLRNVSKHFDMAKGWLPNFISVIGFLLMAIWWIYSSNK
jgi:uncharacterized membrane protein YphA (DoxX/SURF4 family)